MKKPLIVLVGPTGVGKSEFCVQYALLHAPATIFDLDIYNPYFRPREISGWLSKYQIEVKGNQTDNTTNQDLPFIANQFHNANGLLLVDCAGDVQGLMPLKVLRDELDNFDLQCYMVYNAYRNEASLEFYQKLQSIIVDEMGLWVNGLINNTNLLDLTDWSMIEHGIHECEALAKQLGLPIWMGMCDQQFMGMVKTDYPWLFVNELTLRKVWMGE